jgi:hypothetical protein
VVEDAEDFVDQFSRGWSFLAKAPLLTHLKITRVLRPLKSNHLQGNFLSEAFKNHSSLNADDSTKALLLAENSANPFGHLLLRSR